MSGFNDFPSCFLFLFNLAHIRHIIRHITIDIDSIKRNMVLIELLTLSIHIQLFVSIRGYGGGGRELLSMFGKICQVVRLIHSLYTRRLW